MLSKRLKAIADMVLKGSVVFDVGCDHALLPIYLVKNGYALKAYASDNKSGPLNKAKENIKRYHLEDRIKTVLADGLDKVSADADTVIIAGMGPLTALAILKKADLTRFKNIIIQVNRHEEKIREFISLNNYTILDEDMVYDDFFYPIIKFNTDHHESYKPEELRLGPILLKKRSPVFKEYLSHEVKRLIDDLKKADDPLDKRHLELMMIKEALNKQD